MEFAFVDEVFKANSEILNSMLSVVTFHDDTTTVQCPLVSMFGASNELPEGKSWRRSSIASFFASTSATCWSRSVSVRCSWRRSRPPRRTSA